jgi:hypothetical protein
MSEVKEFKIKQLSIFSENKPGRLAAVTKAMRDEKIDILAFSIAEGAGYGVIRLIVDAPEKALDRLTKEGFMVKFTDVIAVEMTDKPGGLYELTQMLASAGINIEYAYAYRDKPCAVLIIRVEAVDEGIKKIQAHGAKLLDSSHFHTSTCSR